MVEIREYGDGLPVEIVEKDTGRKHGKRWIVEAYNEAGHCSTWVDLVDLVEWVKENRPDLLDTKT